VVLVTYDVYVCVIPCSETEYRSCLIEVDMEDDPSRTWLPGGTFQRGPFVSIKVETMLYICLSIPLPRIRSNPVGELEHWPLQYSSVCFSSKFRVHMRKWHREKDINKIEEGIEQTIRRRTYPGQCRPSLPWYHIHLA
jgi:hypothetical protein